MPSLLLPEAEIHCVSDDVFHFLCNLAVEKCSKKLEKKKASCGGAAMRKRLLIKNFVAQMLAQGKEKNSSKLNYERSKLMVSCSVEEVDDEEENEEDEEENEEDEEIDEQTEFDDKVNNSEMEEDHNNENNYQKTNQIYENCEEMEQENQLINNLSVDDYDHRRLSNCCTSQPSSSKLYSSLSNMEMDMNPLNYEYNSETMILYNNNNNNNSERDSMLNGISPCCTTTTVMNGVGNVLFYENNNCRNNTNNNWLSEDFHTVPPSREYSMEEQESYLYTIYSSQYSSSQMPYFTNSAGATTTINSLNSPIYNTIMSVEALPENILEDFTQWDEKKFLNDNLSSPMDNHNNKSVMAITPNPTTSNESAGNGCALTNLVTMVPPTLKISTNCRTEMSASYRRSITDLDTNTVVVEDDEVEVMEYGSGASYRSLMPLKKRPLITTTNEESYIHDENGFGNFMILATSPKRLKL